MTLSELMQNEIVELYEKQKYSAVQIAQKLNISDSSVRYCLSKKKIQKRSISEAITNVYLTRFNKKPFFLKENLSRKEIELKVAGIMLYWGEGAKTGNTIKFSNSDPEMIQLFLSFLRNICGISEERVKVLIHMYPDHNEKELKMFWAQITNLSEKQFYKSYIHKGEKGTYKNKSRHGTLAVNYSDKKLFNILLSWIDQYKKKLIL